MTDEDDFLPSNMVIVANFAQDYGLNLNTIYELITLLPVNFTLIAKPKNRIKIPYFGVENAIISASHKFERRGIRCGGGQIPNSVAIDLQYAKKNIHIKINKNNLLLMGILNEEMGAEASQVCLNHIKMVSDMWESFLKLSNDEKDKIIKYVLTILKDKNDELLMYDDPNVIKHFSRLNRPEINLKIVKFLTLYTYEHKSYQSFENKMRLIRNIESHLFIGKLPEKIFSFDISNSIYNYNIDTILPMVKLSQNLYEKGLAILYNNWLEPNIMYIMIPVSILSNKDETEKIKKIIHEDNNLNDIKKKIKAANIKAHRFQINKKGKIRQTSPSTISNAYNVRNLILTFIYEIVENFKEENDNLNFYNI